MKQKKNDSKVLSKWAVIGALIIGACIYALSFYNPSLVFEPESAKESKYYTHTMYKMKVDYIEGGDIIVSNVDGKRLIPMHEAFKFDVDVILDDLIVLFVDKNDKIVNMEVISHGN